MSPVLRHAEGMARGWESKSIEAQQEERDRPRESGPVSAPEDAARASRRGIVELSRARAAADLAAATIPAHRTMLETAIRALDAELADLTRKS